MASNPNAGPDSSEDPVDPIELAAAEWLVQRDRGMDAIQRAEFERWLCADERHARAFSQLEETWQQLEHVPAERLPVPPPRSRPWGWLAGGLAAAAAVVVLVFLTPERSAEPGPVLARRAATSIGGFERLELPDGSVVRLNTASELTVDYTAHERRVTLTRGEASFDVEKDKTRPFVVHVDGIDVRAVGTAFNVRRQEHAIEVLVTEGRVQLANAASGEGLLAAAPTTASPAAGRSSSPSITTKDTDAQPMPLLGAGQRATIRVDGAKGPTAASVAKVAPAEAARALAWRSRRLEFSAEPLSHIAAEFNRYNQHRLVIADAELGKQRFGGKFPSDDFETLVRLLETNFGVVVERHETETVLRLPAARR